MGPSGPMGYITRAIWVGGGAAGGGGGGQRFTVGEKIRSGPQICRLAP